MTMQDETGMKDELDFLAAMQAYKRDKETGGPEAIAAAEEAWRQQVRGEFSRGNCEASE